MKQVRLANLFLVLIVLASGCVKQPATATPMPLSTNTPTPSPDMRETVLQVGGTAMTLADLKNLPQVKVEADGVSYQGVRILDVLAAAGMSNAASISLIASDGYAAEVAVADLDEQCILAFDKDGTFDTVLPGQDKGGWVRDVVEIACPVAQVENAVLTANGKPFTMDDLKTLKQLDIEVEGTSYTGVQLLDLLAAAGIAGEGTISLLASDGYAGSVDMAMLTEECILAYNDQGGVNTVLPGMDRGAWVKYVIQIEFVAKQSSTEPIPTVKPIEPGDSVIVIDSLGNEVTIPTNVTRVASMRSGITEIICALGQQDKIVAVDEMTKVGGGYGAFIAGVHPGLMERAAPFAGGDINAEEMLRLAPDLVLHGGYGRIKQAEALKKQVPELPVVIAHFETIDAYMDDIRIVAQCVNAQERAEKLIAYLQGTLDFVHSRVKDIPEADKVRVFYGGHDIYHAYTPETFEHAQIDLAGGVNVAQDLVGWLPEVSPEQMLVWDPQVIVVLNGVDVEAILNDPKVAGVSAVKDRRVYALPEAGWDFSSPRALFCIEWLATKLYPEHFADVDIQAEADAFYHAVFGVNYSGPPLADPSQTIQSDKRIVTDMAGRRVQIPTAPRRVVSAFPYITFTALALGGEDILVGVDSAAAQNANLIRVYPAVKDIPAVGTAFNINQESVLAAAPEFVLTVTWDRDPDKTQQTLGLPVVCVDLDYYQESIEFIAQVLGGAAKAKADELLAYYEGKMAYVHEHIAGIADDDRPRVYVAGGDGFLFAFGRESTWHFEVVDAGGAHVSQDLIGGGSHQVSAEQILLWNPDVIILDPSCTDSVAEVLADPRWQSLNAVKEKRVYRAPAGYLDVWGRPHIESVLARIWLATLFYPTQIDLDIVAEAQSFYTTFYGITLSRAEIESMLKPE